MGQGIIVRYDVLWRTYLPTYLTSLVKAPGDLAPVTSTHEMLRACL
jgi:hypothetical protein